MSRLYKYAGDENGNATEKENKGRGFDSGDWGYAAIGAGLGGGAGWLLGRLIHGDQYKQDKMKQLIYALGGAGVGGTGGLFGGKSLVNALTGDSNGKENSGDELVQDPATGKMVPAKQLEEKEYNKAKRFVTVPGTTVGAAFGAWSGSKAGGTLHDMRGMKSYTPSGKELATTYSKAYQAARQAGRSVDEAENIARTAQTNFINGYQARGHAASRARWRTGGGLLGALLLGLGGWYASDKAAPYILGKEKLYSSHE